MTRPQNQRLPTEATCRSPKEDTCRESRKVDTQLVSPRSALRLPSRVRRSDRPREVEEGGCESKTRDECRGPERHRGGGPLRKSEERVKTVDL